MLQNNKPQGKYIENGHRYSLTSPTAAPNADAFLWNTRMMIQATCRGYATAQFMQPEPAKYAHGPTLAAKTFMQPEHPYFAHHAGRFFYLKDRDTQTLWSAPYEPVRASYSEFRFEPGIGDIRWVLLANNIETTLTLSLTENDAVECWQVSIRNVGDSPRKLSLVPYFPVGYASWMNQSGDYDKQLNAVIASSVTPYQKLEDYPKQKHFKDKTFLLADATPSSWLARLQAFEGEGGLHNPDALSLNQLPDERALYECPACIMQFDIALDTQETGDFRFLFGAAETEEEIAELKAKHLSAQAFAHSQQKQIQALKEQIGRTQIESPDVEFNHAMNVWLPRQLYYHGDTQRLTTDPQTRNYLQDAMGMAYLAPQRTREALCTALSQQHASGQMPDGILLEGATELKYINQIPHTDHGVWVILCMEAYLRETADVEFLNEHLPYANNEIGSILEHVSRSLDWLLADRNEQGLSYIQQGDWCDPMNMVGPKGIGVSAWLTQALAVALKHWAPICEQAGHFDLACRFEEAYRTQIDIINSHCWDGAWYLRGITDDKQPFGTKDDVEGQIFLNTQAWALLADAPEPGQKAALLNSVTQKLDTPYGAMLCAPAFTHMHEHIGRVTQKFPGTAENGSVYNHAAMFWCAALFEAGESERAFKCLTDLWAFEGQGGLAPRGQIPVYIPNYYRGAYHQFPEAAGRSSRLFNTGTVAWAYQIFIERLLGLRGTFEGILVQPNLPADWPGFNARRVFREAILELTVIRDAEIREDHLTCNGEPVSGFKVKNIQAGEVYKLVYSVGRKS